MENNKSLIKPAFKNYFRQFSKSLPFLGFFTLVIIAMWLFEFVLTKYGYSLGIFGVILLGLILIPLYFATQVSAYTIYREDKEVPSQGFFKLFKLYFNPSFMGIYRVIRTLLLSILWSFLASFVFAIIYVSISGYVDPDLANALSTMSSYLESGDSEALMNFMETSEAYLRFGDMITYVSSTVECATFLFYMARNSASMYLSEVINAPSPRFVTDSYKNAFRGRHVLGYNKDFFKGTWFIFLAMAIMYAAGSIVGYYVFMGNELQWLLMASMGLGFSLILIPFALPYFFIFLSNLVERYKKGFIESALELIKLSFDEMKRRNLFAGEENEEKWKEAMKSYEDGIKKDDETIDADTKEKEDETNMDDYGSSDHH